LKPSATVFLTILTWAHVITRCGRSVHLSIATPKSKFRVKDPVPAVLRVNSRRSEYVSLPVGAVLTSVRGVATPVIGMFSVICEQREYSVLGSDLVRKCDEFRA